MPVPILEYLGGIETIEAGTPFKARLGDFRIPRRDWNFQNHLEACQNKPPILEYLGGIETRKGRMGICECTWILEYLGGIETYAIFLKQISQIQILEYLGGIET